MAGDAPAHLGPRPAALGGALAGPPRDGHVALTGGDGHRRVAHDAAAGAAAVADLGEERDVTEADVAGDVDLAAVLHREHRQPVDLARARCRRRRARPRSPGTRARARSPASPLANDVCPMPAMAVRSASGPATTTSLPRRSSARLPALELGRTPLDEARPALLHVLRAGHELLGVRLVPERSGAVGLERAVGEPLRERDRAASASWRGAPPTRRASCRAPRRGTTLLTRPMRSASAAGTSSPKKNSSFAFCGPTRRVSRYAGRRRPGRCARRMNTSMKRASSAMITRSLARARCMPAAGGGAVDARDDRLLAVEDRRDQPLEPALDRAAASPTIMPGAPARPLRRRARLAEVGAGAEALLAVAR